MAGTSTGIPLLTADCRAGFILLPAWITLPITTVPTFAGSSVERVSTALMAIAPKSGADIVFRLPS